MVTRLISLMLISIPSDVIATMIRIVDEEFENSMYRVSRSNFEIWAVKVSTMLLT
jgi:hypothetical protein